MSKLNESFSLSSDTSSRVARVGSGRSLSKARLGLVAALSVCAGLGVSLAQGQAINAQGWTVLEPSVDTRFVFVSSSTGNDSNSGYSPSMAVKTFERAKELIRGDSADWMLLKRGDVWNEAIGVWNISGRSEEERLVITSYGDAAERPKIVISSGNVITGGVIADVNHVAIVGLHMEGDRPEQETARGVRWLSEGEDLLIEDCYFEGFKDNVTCEAINGAFHNFALRRSVIADSWSTDGHSQGLFVIRTTGVVIEENVFDHNGWNEQVAGAEPSEFNQNIYVQKGVTGVEFLGNITARASGAGVQLRSGAQAIDNLIYANPMGMRFGYRTIDWPTEQATGSIVGNVVLGGPMATAENAGMGMWIERVADTDVRENVIAHYYEGTVSWAFSLAAKARNVNFIDNVVYDWLDDDGAGRAIKSSVRDGSMIHFVNNKWYMPGSERVFSIVDIHGMDFSSNTVFGFESNDDVFHIEGSVLNYDEWNDQSYVGHDDLESPTFPDSRGRDLDMYAQHIGLADADAFLAAARNQSRTHWDADLTGRAAAQWIREGYIVQD